MSSSVNETSTVCAAPSSVSLKGILGEILRSRGFLICLAMLSAFAATFHGWRTAKGHRLVKAALPLRLPLDQLDHKNRLGHYRFLKATTIQADVINALGTDQYIQWMLEDTRPDRRNQPANLIHCFVTYYTGTPDQVPHVPEECYQASGYNAVNDEVLDIPITALGEDVQIPVKLMEMERSTFLGVDKRWVMYTFAANGKFRSGRRGVQSVVTSPLSHYAYFSKVELTFGAADVKVTKAEAIRAGTDFLNVLIPVLVEDHWPDWERAEAEMAGRKRERQSQESGETTAAGTS